jgi:type I restriction enzyme M protein
MAIKKSELYSSIWKSCDELRGGMDASQYKDYVLVFLFMKYVSDKYYGIKNAPIEVPNGGSFKDMSALKGKADIGEGINKIIGKLAEANDLKGVIDVADFNDSDKLGKGKEMVDRLSNLIVIFEDENLDFSGNRAEGDDILGDAYEYLMRHFATESGKSKGQFYTPAEVSRIMAKVIGISKVQRADTTVYDPTCGSGSLLLKTADEVSVKISIYGQEMDNPTRALAVMNMWLHDNPASVIKQGNTLASPQFTDEKTGQLKTFDFAVANPPFSNKAWRNGFDPANDVYERFTGYGIPPAKNGDYAFLLHLIRSLKSKGKGAIILPHGVLFRGNAEAEIRTNIIRKGLIKGIIGLPANLFYGTSIPACIVVIDKENAEGRKGIFMIDASKGFVKDGNKNRLREQDIHKIVDVFNKQLEIPKYSRMVPVEEIERNEFNLNIPRYIDSQEPEDLQDIEAHLLGDIPNRDIDDFDNYWKVYPSLKSKLFIAGSRNGYSKLKISPEEIKQTIFTHPEFVSFSQEIDAVLAGWKKKNTKLLRDVQAGIKPKQIIATISEDILKSFADEQLIDRYDVYQHLMTYWNEIMQDDMYVLAVDGWKAGNVLIRKIRESKDKKKKEIEGLEGLEGKLIPIELIINRYFDVEQKAIEKLESQRDDSVRQQEEMVEEHNGEEGLLAEVIDEKDKIAKGEVLRRIKEIKDDIAYDDELTVLRDYLKLIEQEAEAKKKIKEAQSDLEKKVISKYKVLTEDEIKTLLIDDKWIAVVERDIKTEMERISQRLTQRIKELAQRYETPLPKLTEEVEALTSKVDAHLHKMGFKWN